MPDDPYTPQQRSAIDAICNFVAANFGKQGWVSPRISGVLSSPAFTTYVLEIPRTISSSLIINRTADLEIALRVQTNAVSIQPGAEHGGVLVQVRKSDEERLRTKVWYDDVVGKAARQLAGRPFAAAVGFDEMGKPVIIDIDGDEPHLLVCGQSGSGKSYLMHVILVQMLSKNRPSEVQVAIIDPKGTFGMRYAAVPHLFAPAVLGTDSPAEIAESIALMKAVYEEMVRRSEIFKERGVSTLRDFRRRFPTERIPILLLVIDEAADLGGSDNKALKEAYNTYAGGIARKGRASGVLLVLGIQRPTLENIGKNVRGQLTQRIVLKLTDVNESGIALNRDKDDAATKLGGRGDGFYLYGGTRRRFIGAYLPDEPDDERPDLLVELAVRDWIIARHGGPRIWPAGVGPGPTGAAPIAPAASPDARAATVAAAIAAEHNAGCSDREWLIVRGVELALADQADDFAAVPLSPAGMVPFVARAAAARGYGGAEVGAEEIFTALARFFPERDGRPQKSRTFKLARFNVERRLVGRFSAASAAPADAPTAPQSAPTAAPSSPRSAPSSPRSAPSSPRSAHADGASSPSDGRDRAAEAERVRSIRDRERRDP